MKEYKVSVFRSDTLVYNITAKNEEDARMRGREMAEQNVTPVTHYTRELKSYVKNENK